MKSRIFPILFCVSVLCATPLTLVGMETTQEAPANAKTVTNELALAEASRQRAAQAGAEWLETSSLIEQAHHAAANQEWTQALALARRATEQGELAVEQAERESTAWRERVIQ